MILVHLLDNVLSYKLKVFWNFYQVLLPKDQILKKARSSIFRHVYLCNNENSLGSESSLYHDRIFVTVDISNILRYANNGTYDITLHNECL